MMVKTSLREYFEDILEPLPVKYEVKAYMVSIFAKYQHSEYDLSKSSLTMKYAMARDSRSFEKFQTLGDWLFFVNVIHPESLNGASKTYYYSLGQMSYAQCYSLLNRQWRIYEYLADDFIDLSNKARVIIRDT